MHSTIHAVCGQQKGQNRAKSHVWLIFKKKKKIFFLLKRAGRHFGFFKRTGRHEKGAGRRALQKKPRQNTVNVTYHGQWWSMRRMQRWQMRQWWARGGRYVSHLTHTVHPLSCNHTLLLINPVKLVCVCLTTTDVTKKNFHQYIWLC